MKNIGHIIKREYTSRVMTRKFFIVTLITPLAFALMFVVIGVIMSYTGDKERTILVSDPGELLDRESFSLNNLTFEYADEQIQELRGSFNPEAYDGILHIPALEDLDTREYEVYYYADKSLDLNDTERIKGAVRRQLRNYKIVNYGFDQEQLSKLDVAVSIDPKPVDPQQELDEAGRGSSMVKAEMAFLVGMILGFIMYMMLILNGSMIMRSVMEEKINRIVEVMISTVKPFDLMLGKILGVGAVGMTQIVIWAITIPLLASLITVIFGIDVSPAMNAEAMGGNAAMAAQSTSAAEGAIRDLFSINWMTVIPLLIVYYVGGFLLYSSLFAAVGSAAGDDLGESQSLIWPVMIPIILAIYIGISAGQAPDSTLAVFASYFPLFSPIVMPIRIIFGPPWWEIAISLALLALGVLLFVWISGRIYRIGILLYGKKATFKELAKWLFVR